MYTVFISTNSNPSPTPESSTRNLDPKNMLFLYLTLVGRNDRFILDLKIFFLDTCMYLLTLFVISYRETIV